MAKLCDLSCRACRGGAAALKGPELRAYAEQVPDWKVIDEHHLSRTLKFPDFATALAFVNRVGALAEEEGHHPDIHLAWGRLRIKIWTHKADGLTESDFILAAKIDAL
jgi:4a-hydroxytetrahydrobiopterin dehydratase